MRKAKGIKLLSGLVVLVGLLITLGGCTDLLNFVKDFEQDFKGLNMVVQSYDSNSQLIDSIEGKSVKIERDTTFDTYTTDLEINTESKVISLTIGGSQMSHVGSSLIAYETGMKDVFNEYEKTVDLNNTNRSVPIINSMVNKFRNQFTGKSKTLLIRSQDGFPLATFTGDDIRMDSTDVPSSTNFLIDGKRLFVYRCDYTVYDNKLLLD